MPDWYADEEEARIHRYEKSIRAQAEQYGARLPEPLIRSLATSQALAYLHHRETLRALSDAMWCARDNKRRGEHRREGDK